MEKWAKSQNKRSKTGVGYQAPNAVPVESQLPPQLKPDDNINSTADTAYDLLVGGKQLPQSDASNFQVMGSMHETLHLDNRWLGQIWIVFETLW